MCFELTSPRRRHRRRSRQLHPPSALAPGEGPAGAGPGPHPPLAPSLSVLPEAPALTRATAAARRSLSRASPALFSEPLPTPRQRDCLAGPQCSGDAAGTPFSSGLSFPRRFLRILLDPPPTVAQHRVPPGLSLRFPSSSAALSPPTPACDARGTMISTKEKNKSPKDSMTLLPCFYFVEVRGLLWWGPARGLSSTHPGDPPS